MKIAAATAVLAAFLLAACNVVMGPLNQDEGWYLLAGLNTASGMMPYRDYFYSQAPFLPYFYAFASPLWAPLGVLGGRIFTSLLGLLSACLCAGFAWRVSSQRRGLAALCAWLLTACCPVYSYFTVIPKTYALASLLVSGAFFVLAGKNRFRFEICAVLLHWRAAPGFHSAYCSLSLVLDCYDAAAGWVQVCMAPFRRSRSYCPMRGVLPVYVHVGEWICFLSVGSRFAW